MSFPGAGAALGGMGFEGDTGFEGDMGFEGEAGAQYDEADGEDDDVTRFEIVASACLQVNSVCNSHRL